MWVRRFVGPNCCCVTAGSASRYRSMQPLPATPTSAILPSGTSSSSSVRIPLPVEMFHAVIQGGLPPVSVQRAFLMSHFRDDLAAKGIHDVKVGAMDSRACGRLLKKCVLDKYLALPMRVFAFDMEFTEIPRFTAEGPTAEITEIGMYSPARNERLSVLVRPTKCIEEGVWIPKATVELTGITNDMIAKEGVPFDEAWARVEAFMASPEPDELPGAESRMLLLSHGGKLADVSMLQWALRALHRDVPSQIHFGDTFSIIRDAHRRRPVTPDKHPPSWRLSDLVGWLRVDDPTANKAHRAGDDAKMTWDALYHTLDRYGEDTLSPRQQLVLRFFEAVVRDELVTGRSSRDDDAFSLDGRSALSALAAVQTLQSFDLSDVFDQPATNAGHASGSQEDYDSFGAAVAASSSRGGAARRGGGRGGATQKKKTKSHRRDEILSPISSGGSKRPHRSAVAAIGGKKGIQGATLFVGSGAAPLLHSADVVTDVPDL